MAKTRSLRKRKRRAGRSRRGGLAISTISVIAFIGFSVILGLALTIGQIDTLSRLKWQSSEIARVDAQRAAAAVQDAVAYYRDALSGFAADSYTLELLRAGDAQAIAQREMQIKAALTGALRVRLLPIGVREVDTGAAPHLGFACLTMMRTAERSKAIPPVEVHAPGTAQAHIDVVAPVVDREANTVVGHLQLAVHVRMLDVWALEAAGKGFVELRQKVPEGAPVSLASAGTESSKTGPAFVDLPVKGTSWTLLVWTKAAPPGSMFSPIALSVFGAAVTLAALLVFLLNRALSRGLRADLESLMNMAVDAARGSLTHEYSLRMREFRDAARVLDDLPAQRGAAGRERDDDPESLNLADLHAAAAEAEPLLAGRDGLAVEEINAPGAFAEPAPATAPQPAATTTPAAAVAAAPKPAAAPATGAPALPPPEIFKAYDIRGIVGRTLTSQHAMLIGRALGSEAVRRGLSKIVFARDGRLSGPELGGALVKGLQSTGLQVIDIGMVPTPVLYYAASEASQGTGVMLTGSHNPPDYNGFKMMLGGETLAGDTIQNLRRRIEQNDFASGNGAYQTANVLGNYTRRITSDVKVGRPLKVVVDCGNGVAGAIAPALYRELGCEVTELYCDVDGNFPNHHPDPSQPQNLRDLIEAVRTQRADVGFAFDGDGDRLGVVSSDGSVIWPDRLMMLYAADVLSRNHGAKIIYDVKCSSNLTQQIWEKGGEPLMWKTGHSLIKAKLKESGALLAGEMSGHIFFKERWYGFDDALYSGARLLEILANDLRPPRVVFAGLPDASNTPELRIDLPEGEQFRFMERLMDKAEFADANVIMIDGIRADWADGWGLVRASNTTPSLILRFEGKDDEALKTVQNQFRKLLLEVDPALQLPF